MDRSSELARGARPGGLTMTRAWRPLVGAALCAALSAASIAGVLSQSSVLPVNRPQTATSTARVLSFVDSGVGNYPVNATLNFIDFAGPGGDQVTITPAGGGSGRSNCTRDESSDSFKLARANPFGPVPSQNSRSIKMTAKDEGSCLSEASYETWNVQLHGPGTHGTGHVWLGQNRPGGSYYLSCSNGEGKPWEGPMCFVQSAEVDAQPYHAVAIISPRR
jgi:hypothetical protein